MMFATKIVLMVNSPKSFDKTVTTVVMMKSDRYSGNQHFGDSWKEK